MGAQPTSPVFVTVSWDQVSHQQGMGKFPFCVLVGSLHLKYFILLYKKDEKCLCEAGGERGGGGGERGGGGGGGGGEFSIRSNKSFA